MPHPKIKALYRDKLPALIEAVKFRKSIDKFFLVVVVTTYKYL